MLAGYAPPPRAAYRNRRRGFSLIEAAIVLAVVGAVIGTLWGVSAKFYEDYMVNKTVEDLALIVKGTQNLISVRDTEAIGDGVNITTTLLSAGVIPKDWTSGNRVKNPFGEWVSFYNRPKYFEVWFHDIPKTVCIKFIVRVSSMGAMAEHFPEIGSRPSLGFLYFIYVNGAGNFGTDVFPIAPTIAETACNQRTNSVAVYYGYTR